MVSDKESKRLGEVILCLQSKLDDKQGQLNYLLKDKKCRHFILERIKDKKYNCNVCGKVIQVRDE